MFLYLGMTLIFQKVIPLDPNSFVQSKTLRFSLSSSQRTMLPQPGACKNWKRYVNAFKCLENMFCLFSMMLILLRCESKVGFMVKPLSNMNEDSNKTMRRCKDGGKLSHKWDQNLVGMCVISKCMCVYFFPKKEKVSVIIFNVSAFCFDFRI